MHTYFFHQSNLKRSNQYWLLFLLYKKGDFMKEWLFDQVYHFNLIIFVSVMVFNVALSRNNVQKMLSNQSKELYLEIEEVKDEIRQSENRLMKK